MLVFITPVKGFGIKTLRFSPTRTYKLNKNLLELIAKLFLITIGVLLSVRQKTKTDINTRVECSPAYNNVLSSIDYFNFCSSILNPQVKNVFLRDNTKRTAMVLVTKPMLLSLRIILTFDSKIYIAFKSSQ